MYSSTEATDHRGRTRAIWQAAALFGIALVAGLCCLASPLLNDPDTQWHIAVGRLIWQTDSVPETDVFSHTFAGMPWIAKEWISQLLLFAAFAVAGWWGVAILTVIAIALSFSILFAFLLSRLTWTIAFVVLLAALPLTLPEFVARPQILVLPLTVLWVVEIVRAREHETAPRWWAAGLMALWANMHASYPVGLALAALLAGEAVLNSPWEKKRSAGLHWALFLAGSTLAACVSPYGYKTLVVALALSQTSETTSYINEWQPIALDGQGLIAVLTLVLCLAALQKDWRANIVRTAAVLLLGYMTIRHARFALLFGMLTPILVAGPIAEAFRSVAVVSFRVPRPSVAIGALLACALITAGLARPEPNPDVTPTAALRFAEAKGLTGRVYNDYNYGGFLILNGVKTFIDGRSDQLFLGGFTSRLSAALANPDERALAAILNRQHVTWALVRRDSQDGAAPQAHGGLVGVLRAGGSRRVRQNLPNCSMLSVLVWRTPIDLP